jgi:hypothetical protein
MRGSKVPGFRARMFVVRCGQPEQSPNFAEGEIKLPGATNKPEPGYIIAIIAAEPSLRAFGSKPIRS